MESKSTKNSLFVQAGILAAAGIIVRIIGLLYQSPLTGIIGDEGNGYYSMAYNFYAIVLLVSSYSIPSAISKVIAQKLAVREYRNAQRIFYCALIYVCIVGGVGSLLVFFGADWFVGGNSRPVLRVFAPTIFFFGLLGVLRGYFQAHKTMVPTSVSQILEQIFNAGVSLGGAYGLIRLVQDQDQTTQAIYGAIGSAIGTGSGVVVALIFMSLVYYGNRKDILRRVNRDPHPDDSYGQIFKTILLIVTPFILSTFIYNFTTVLDQKIYTYIMETYKALPEKEVALNYGIYSRKAVTIANIPIALASALSSALMPNIASSFALGKKEETARLVSRVVRMTMLVSIPAAVALFALSKPVMMVLFPQMGTIDRASFLLAGMAITVVFYSLSTVTNAVLQGIGMVNRPVIHAAAALVVQAGVLYVILRYTEWGNFGLVSAVIVYSLLMCVLNDIAVNKALHVRQNVKTTYVMPLLSAVIMGIVAFGVYHLFAFLMGKLLTRAYFVNLIALVPTGLIGLFLYALVLIRSGALSESMILSFPKGKKIAGLLKKLRML